MQTVKSVLYMASGILFGLFIAALVWVVARNPSGEAITLRPAPTDKPIVVHITGAVPRPGVYALPQGARVQDVISAAGGFLAEADTETALILRANLKTAKDLKFPISKVPPRLSLTPGLENAASESSSELIDINTASQAELETLPGIGPTTAKKIIDYRDTEWSFCYY